MATITLDNLINESGRRAGIGAAAEPLTRDLLKFMTQRPGGLSAFLERFRTAGLGAELTNFLGGRSTNELPPKAVDSVIGEANVASMAKRAGVAPAAAHTALGFEIPQLIALLTPGGKAVNALPGDVEAFVARQDQAPPIAMAVVDEQVPPVAMATMRAAPSRNLNWLWALLGAALLAGLLWMLLPRARAPAPARTVEPTIAAAPTRPPAATSPVPPAAVTETVTALNRDLSRSVLNFRTASAELPSTIGPELQRAAQRIQALPAGAMIEIAGHTDNVGDDAMNMDLSQRRANAVRDALIRDGVAPARLVAKGYGETQPVASNATPEGRYQNRRTTFSVLGAPTTTTSTTTTVTTP